MANPLEQQLTKIVEGPGTKADRARQLFALGCDRADVRDLLDMSYSQAHSIWKRMQNGNASPRATGSASNYGHSGRAKSTSDLGPSREGSKASSSSRLGRQLCLSPTQTRLLTHDGHVVVRIDQDRGPVCRTCKQRLTFSLQWLGFLHTDSQAAPTEVEDRYD